jgi:DNA polymerase-3 subunit delta'
MTEKHKNQEPAHTHFFRDIVGQDRVLALLRAALRQGRLAHAHLFLGPEGVGRATVARALAAALNCHRPREDGDACGDCPSCRRLQAGTHPDFLVISPEKDKSQISIERVREFRRLTAYPPLDGGWRVALIKPAEALTAQNDAAANALLKTLEEPPPRHLLILTAGVEADLLPTVVSRCQKLSFVPLPFSLVAQELERRRGLPPEDARLLAALSRGSLGRALALDPEELKRQRAQVLSDLDTLARGAPGQMLDWAARVNKSKAEVENFLLLARLWYRDLLLSWLQAPPALLAHQDLAARLEEEKLAGAPELWFARLSALSAAGRHLKANLNPELTLNILGLQMGRTGAAP